MSYWDGKKVVITGGAGMVGLQLCTLLRDANADVQVLDNFSRGKNRVDGVRYIYSDVTVEGSCRDTFKLDGKPIDAIFNLAAEVAGVAFNQTNHGFMFERNLLLQMMPLRIAAEYNVPRFLQTSSVCVYAPEHNHPCKEENGLLDVPTGANLGYSQAKRMGEYLAKWYSDRIHTVIVRPSNIYGPADYYDQRAHVIPALIKKCLDDDKIIVNGTGREEREFIYSRDVANGMMAALEHGSSGSVYNLGTSGETCITINDLLTKIQEWTNTVDKPHEFAQIFDGGDNKRWSLATKAETELGWKWETSLDVGLQEMINWYYVHRMNKK